MADVDQRGFVNQPPVYLSGREAAALLGIKRETLYAYASRGLVRSEPGERGRARRYLRDDLERLKTRHDARAGHGPVAAGALRWGEPVLSSALTAIDRAGPIYRGLCAVELAEEASFEAVAELLWASEPPRAGGLARPIPAWDTRGLGVRVAHLAALLPKGSAPITTLLLGVPALAAADAERFDGAMDAERQRARALIRRMAALIGLSVDPRRAAAALHEPTVARTLLAALGVGDRGRAERAERGIDRALILSADHELNASAFTVRIAASARADLYACVGAGLGTLSGPRHGGACDRVEALVAEAGRPEAARAVIQERARRGDELPGFGHPLYPEGDPRAAALLARAFAQDKKSLALRTLLALVEAMRDSGREAPSLDIGLVAETLALGLPAGSAAALFAVGRTAGWIAHALEQRGQGFLVRPRAHYTGPPRVEKMPPRAELTPAAPPPPGRDRR